jgi:uncharacterized protein
MTPTIRTATPTLVRQLAITRQRLAGKPPEPTSENMLDVVQDIGCLQLDPTSAVARNHLLVMFSRVGKYKLADLDKLLWEDRSLFEYWAHAASIVLTEDYPIHYHQMQRFKNEGFPWGKRIWDWMAKNKELHDYILAEITEKGALPSKVFEDKSQASWHSSGWTGNRNVGQMLTYMWDAGTLLVAERNKGGHRVWDLAERVLPDWTPRDILSDHEMVYRAAQKSLRALGIAQMKEIKLHYIRWRYHDLPDVMKKLEKNGRIEQMQVVDKGKPWPGTWYIHIEDIPLLESLERGEFEPRTTLLSPFDNLICDRARTQKLFDYDFRIEIYVPKEKRQYGYYVLSILHGDKIIGRIDPQMDRKNKRLNVNAVYAEPDAPMNKATGRVVAGAIQELATFLDAKEIVYTDRVPDGWHDSLK